MKKAPTFTVLALSSLLSFACGEPTLEEACVAYCEAAADAGCGDLQPAECSLGCGQLEQALIDAGQGACLDQYTALLDCAASADFECRNGVAIPVSGCTSEALDYVDCIDDDGPQ